MKKISEKAMRNAKASLAISGFYITPEAEKLVRENLEGKITDKEFMEKLSELVERS
ncbi:antitoxin VbhA family protein [Virgibacillus sp. 6R]|uniref:antitoxin VbhA family protein n=1 Tax=Metabacillus niabensis TaxID=324854 RepID=UPI001642BA40